MEPNTVYWSLFRHGNWNIHIAATSMGLCFVGSNNGSWLELSTWVNKQLAKFAFIRHDDYLKPFSEQLSAYFNGKRDNFTFPIDIHGTPFQMSVWKVLHDIPYGSTRSYSEIATFLQKPKSVRAVAAAIGANTLLIAIPCHRVIGKNGKLTGYRGGLEMKQQLLALEGG